MDKFTEILLISLFDDGIVELIKDVLTDKDIAFIIKQDRSNELSEAIMGKSKYKKNIYVAEEHIEEAKIIIDELGLSQDISAGYKISEENFSKWKVKAVRTFMLFFLVTFIIVMLFGLLK